ncbi:nitroreductase family deazaflavin-dependent oxidoreductase [Micromonospora avicenniae]|uniref:nitroreductase family deazaflavin-dependent oxidoreductase n=1 Tax=Micromonospora avicenniae TaxID=1198245 RepID=UPI003328F266
MTVDYRSSGVRRPFKGGEREAPQAGAAWNQERLPASSRSAVEPTMTVDEAVIRALTIGPDSSRDERTIEITTLGRRSGMPRRNEIWLHRVDGRWYLTGMPVPRSWYANLRANPRFMVHLKHGVTADLPATAVPVDERTRRRVIAAVLDLQNRPDIAARVGQRQSFDVWFAHSPLVEVVFDDEQLRAASSARPE